MKNLDRLIKIIKFNRDMDIIYKKYNYSFKYNIQYIFKEYFNRINDLTFNIYNLIGIIHIIINDFIYYYDYSIFI